MAKSVYDSLNEKVLIKRGAEIVFRLDSKTSKGFKVDRDRIIRRDFLKTIFDIKDAKFDEKYEEASTGSGNPYKDFDALHSSALCALLSFYNISDLKIDKTHYDKAFFEVQNKVIEGRSPSNMDVVLVSKDNKTILFLECKFKEYIVNQKQEVSYDYIDKCLLSKNLYDLLVKNGMAKIEKIEGEDKFAFKTDAAYSQGTKQIISHIVGIESFIKRKNDYDSLFKFYSDKDERRNLYKSTFERIIFQEVLFELEGYENHLRKYREFSEKVRKLFIDSGLINGFEFKPATTYQKIFKGDKGNNRKNVGKIIAEYYRY